VAQFSLSVAAEHPVLLGWLEKLLGLFLIAEVSEGGKEHGLMQPEG